MISMAEQKNYAPLLPTRPPVGLVPWLIGQGKLKKELLIYTMVWREDLTTGKKRRVVELRCTACGGRAYAEKVEAGGCIRGYTSAPYGFRDPLDDVEHISGSNCLCPCCGAQVEVRHIESVVNNWSCIETYPMTVTVVEGRLALLGWCVRKWFTKDGESGVSVWPYEGYVVEKKKIVRLTGYTKYLGSVTLSGRWEQRKRYYDVWGKADLIFPWDGSLLQGTTAENSKLDVYLRESVKNEACPVTYLRLWLARPQVENLIVQGASELVSEFINHARNYFGRNSAVPDLKLVNWKEKSPAKMLGMTRDEFQMLREWKWGKQELEFWQEEKKNGRTLTAEEVELGRSIAFYNCHRVEKEMGLDFRKVARYLAKQKTKDRRSDMSMLWDYWRMARENGRDLAVPQVVLPSHLMRAHDRELEEVNRRKEEASKAEMAARAAKFVERFEKLSAFAWEKDGIIIRPARDEAELKAEGTKLNHCVATYARRHAAGETAIFFLRQMDKPEEPWFTLELDEKRLEVRQNRGKHNCARTEEVQAFETAWLAHIKTMKTKKRKTKKGAHAA